MRNSNKISSMAIEGLLNWPKTVLGLFLLLTAVLGFQATKFEIDASTDTLLTRDNYLYTLSQEVSQKFSPQEFLLVTYEPRDASLFSEQTLENLRALSEQLGALGRVQSVRSILNVPLFGSDAGLLNADLDMAELTIASGNYHVGDLEAEFTNHPIYTDLIVNEDRSATALQVLFTSDPELSELDTQITALNSQFQSAGLSSAQETQLRLLQSQAQPLRKALEINRIDEIRLIRDIVAPFEDVAIIHLGGLHVLAFQLVEIISNDLVVFGAAIGIGICFMLALLFRRLRWVMIPVICCACSVLATMGVFAIVGIKATVISSNFIALQLILTLAIVIHLIVEYRETAQLESDTQQTALIKETLLKKMGPCFFAGITTSIGFASLMFSGIQPVISFGAMMIIAVSFSIIVSLILFPALLEVLSRRQESEELGFVSVFVNALAQLSLKRRGLVLTFTAVLIAISLSGLLRLTVENSFINYFKSDTQVHQELAYIDQEFGGSTPLDLVYTAPQMPTNPDIVISADTMQTLQLIQHSLEQHEAVGRVLSPVNLSNLARDLNNGPLTEYELTAAYWLMDEEFREDLLGAFYDPATGQARMNIWIKDLTPDLNRAELLRDIRSDMAANGIEESNYTLSNMFVLYQDILQRLFSSQILTLGLVYAALALCFLLIFRSAKLAVIGIVPNIIPTLAILGIMGWLNIPLDLMTITIAAITMGIAVDDTIHYIYRFQKEHQKFSFDEAIEKAHASVGVAIFYTSLLIVVGFSLLAFSDFVPSILFGLLTSLAMLLAFTSCLCLLPLLLRWMPEPRRGSAT